MAYRNAYIYFAIADCIVWTLEIMKNLFLFLAIVLNIFIFMNGYSFYLKLT